MNSWMIRKNAGMIPGGVVYEDPRIPEMKWLDDHTFLDVRTREVVAFRLANPRVYPEPEWTDTRFVSNQIAVFNCERLKYGSQYCYEVGPPPPAPPAPPAKMCPDCNIVLKERVCKTCAGRKVLGYTCENCKKEYPK